MDRKKRPASNLAPSLVTAVSLRPKSKPTASLGAGTCATICSTGRQSHQSPTESWAKQPHFQRAASSNSCSNTRKALPEKRRHLPLRFSCAALKGIQPQGAPGGPVGSPAESRFLRLLSPRGKFGVDPLNGFRTDALKVLRRPGGQLVQIIGGEPL